MAKPLTDGLDPIGSSKLEVERWTLRGITKKDARCRGQDTGLGVRGSGFRMQRDGFRLQGSGFGVQGSCRM